MPQLHIFTGGKGGVGKTLCALCSSVYYSSQGASTIIIDLNYHNTDLYHTLKNTADLQRQSVIKDNYGVVALQNKLGPSNTFLIYPLPGGKTFGLLPWKGVEQFFFDINSILHAVNDGVGDVIPKGFEPEYCVVDTGFHLSNLRSTAQGSSDRMSDRLRILQQYDLFIWFVWTIAVANRPDEASASRAALDWLSRIKKDDGKKWFDKTRNFIHVINPHALEPPTIKDLILGMKKNGDRDILPLKHLADISQADAGVAISYESLYNQLGMAIRSYYGHDRIEYFHQIARAIGEPSLESAEMEMKFWRRPKNVIINPYFRSNLLGFTDWLDEDNKYDIFTLRGILGDIYRVISDKLPNI